MKPREQSSENVTYALALASTDGCPSKTMTLSARYVAMMKSCSTMNAVFFACRMYLTKLAFSSHFPHEIEEIIIKHYPMMKSHPSLTS